jgi:DNA-binding transcriptional ArsR family regulator
MSAGIDIARIAALVGEPARAQMLLVLLSGQAMTATELSQAAAVTKQTASTHLSRMVDAGLLCVEHQGRHRYFRLANADVAQLLEHLLGMAGRIDASVPRAGPREHSLRKARVCYDHLAGEMGVRMLDSLLAHGLVQRHDGALRIGTNGYRHFEQLGIDISALSSRRRPPCRACLDWSMRRHHLAGSLGAVLLVDLLERGWARRARQSRAIHFTIEGEALFGRRYPLT